MDGMIADEVAFELIGIQRLDVSSMVLVEVRETIVEVDGRSDIVRDVKQ
jgi:hypothetical protein